MDDWSRWEGFSRMKEYKVPFWRRVRNMVSFVTIDSLYKLLLAVLTISGIMFVVILDVYFVYMLGSRMGWF